ncbi:MAG: hypothetical protein RL738_642 [Bacteroidota bacterium]
MHRALRILLWVLAVLTAALGGLAGYVYTHQDELKAAMLAAVNERLNSPVQIGGLEVDLWGRFPDVSLRFDEVLIPDPQIPSDSLAYAASVYAQFDLIKAVRGTYILQRITLQDGRLKLRWNEDGSNNYGIFKEDSASTGTAAVQLDGVTVLNTKITLSGHGNPPWSQTVLAERVRARGSLDADAFAAELDWELWVPNLAARPVRVEGSAEMQGSAGIFSVPRGELNVAGWPLDLSGELRDGQGSWKLSADDLDVAKVVALIPAALLPDPETLQLAGNVSLKATAVTTTQGSRLVADAVWSEGRLTSGEFDFSGIAARIHADNGAQARASSTELVLDLQSAQSASSQVQGQFRLSNLDAPDVAFQGKVTVATAEFLRWIGITTWDQADGSATGTLGFSQHYASLDELGNQGVWGGMWSGTLALSPGTWRPQGNELPVGIQRGTLTLRGQDVELRDLQLTVGQSDAVVSGTVANALNDRGMAYDLQVSSKQLNAGQIADSELWNGLWTGPIDPNDPPFNDPYRVNLQVGRLHYSDLHLSNVRSLIVGRGLNFSFQQTAADLGGGQIRGSGTWTAADPDGGNLQTQLQFARVRLSTLLREVNNFNQTTITAANVDGILDATATVQVDFDANYDWVPSSLIAEVNFSLEGGRLRGVDALQQLARFAEVEDLKDVRFAPVRNTLYISQQRVLIPEMLLENNALQLKVAGTHNFDQIVDYRFQLQLRELLGGKKPKRSRDLDTYITEESARGPVWVPIRATGPIDKLSIKLDGQSLKQDVKTSVTQDWNKQAEEVKNSFKATEYQSVAPEKKYQFEWNDGDEDTARSINEPDRSRTQLPRLRRKGGGG